MAHLAACTVVREFALVLLLVSVRFTGSQRVLVTESIAAQNWNQHKKKGPQETQVRK